METLYDPATGKGTFVVQRSGTADHPGNEVFVKPIEQTVEKNPTYNQIIGFTSSTGDAARSGK